MMNTTEFPFSTTMLPTTTSIVSQSEKRKISYKRPLLLRSNNFDDTAADALFLSTSSSFSRDDDDDDETGSYTSRDVPDIVNDEHDCDNYSFTSTPKRQKMIDGIFRPLSSSLSSSPLLSPPPLLPKSATFYNDITELSNDELSLLALPDCPTSSSSSLSSSLSVSSSPRISLAPRCLEFLPTSSLSSTSPATTTTATSELEIMKGKRLDDDDETYHCSFPSYADSSDEEYKEEDPTMDFMKENQDYDTVYNNKSTRSDNVSIPTRTSRQEFLFRMNTHHDRYSFLNRRFVLRTNNNKNNRLE
mmetsp:Transcript_44588/g.51441  ORF Transcript_44588/g.51441 Transcript_44588/m.51441 type:complete len:303 (+) Transcript_44588:83-991(+)